MDQDEEYSYDYDYRDTDLHLLNGFTVRSFAINDDHTQILIDGKRGDEVMAYELIAEGDCCSVSWFEGVYELDSLVNHTITETAKLPLPEAFSKVCDSTTHPLTAYNDTPKYYGFSMKTEAGVCTIDFRNNSNGYYGGGVYVRRVW